VVPLVAAKQMSATRASNRVRKPSKRQREELGVATEKVIITVEDTGDNVVTVL
jgi:hypothetical protein